MTRKNNDSRRSAGSRVERHAQVGEGEQQIGTPPYLVLTVRTFVKCFHRKDEIRGVEVTRCTAQEFVKALKPYQAPWLEGFYNVPPKVVEVWGCEALHAQQRSLTRAEDTILRQRMDI